MVEKPIDNVTNTINMDNLIIRICDYVDNNTKEPSRIKLNLSPQANELAPNFLKENKANEGYLTLRGNHPLRGLNNYIQYFINKDVFILIFAASLTLSAIILFMIKLYSKNEIDSYFTTYFTSMNSLVNLWIPIQKLKQKKKSVSTSQPPTANDTDINKYVRYFINKTTFVIIFSATLTIADIVFCMIKLYLIDSDNPQFTIYFTTMISLITLWIPMQFLKYKK